MMMVQRRSEAACKEGSSVGWLECVKCKSGVRWKKACAPFGLHLISRKHAGFSQSHILSSSFSAAGRFSARTRFSGCCCTSPQPQPTARVLSCSNTTQPFGQLRSPLFGQQHLSSSSLSLHALLSLARNITRS